ncbi:START domain-containing protein [Rufibacter glacialis]|uniref:START domain-containing protein n=1 Tax=Rufibacter glacialis TaxID=1259555 RepID=A0A5M8QEJ4_9BACT|nr:START domain-containing protein [Rufibacter glacialis]KAA6434465.1 hypothetical protein FOE74_09745 [Rufibacter glacialis]GGK69859.1 hypothetical protein GCM10011405_17400 [Rufibacter glacialis]
MNKYRLLLFLFLAPWFLSPSHGQETWQLRKNQDGIAVYTKNLEKAQLKQLKVVCELPGTTQNLVQVLKNVEHHPDWVYLNRKTTLLKKKSENALVYYTQADMPWPLTDQDLVVEALFFPVARDNAARVEVRSLPGYLPNQEGFVRIPSSLATWDIRQLPGNKIKVEYQFSVDPGGAIPSWLVNATADIGTLKTFQKLRALLAQKAKKQTQ